MITLGLLETARNPDAMACGIWLKVIHQPRMVADAMMTKMMPVMRVVRTSISYMSVHVSPR